MELTDEIFRERGAQVVAGKAGKSVEKLAAVLALRKADSPGIGDFVEGRASQLQRRMVAQELYESSFASGREVIYLSIMSGKNALGQMPERIRRAEAARTTINVLTWDPAVGVEAIRAFARHLGEEATAAEQVREACDRWRELVKEHPGTIKKAGSYLSSPTMQGLVVLDDWALVEMIPYRTPPAERLSIFLAAGMDGEIFSMFQSAFKRLLADSATL